MNDKTITALAREYAEEISPVRQLEDHPVSKMIADIMRKALSEATAEQIKNFEGFLRFLLRRYCLVEKSKAMQLYSHLLDLVENERISEHYSEWCDLEREYIALFGENVFADYFGSKCLPDAHEDNVTSIEPQPAEPKFKIGDELVWDKRILVKIDEVFADGKYLVFSHIGKFIVKESDLEPYTAAEQSMTDGETEHTKDKFATQMQGKFTEQDFTEAKQMTESCLASIPQFELPKQIEAQINKAMESIKAESRKQFGDFGAANADITIPVYRQMMRFGALLVLSAGYLESEQTDSDRGDYISMTKPTDPNKCTLFGREKGETI